VQGAGFRVQGAGLEVLNGLGLCRIGHLLKEKLLLFHLRAALLRTSLHLLLLHSQQLLHPATPHFRPAHVSQSPKEA